MKYFSLLLTAIGCFFLSSCMQTDVVENDNSEKGRSKLVINLNAPDEEGTRAGDGYQLRYVAKLYKGSGNEMSTVIERKELIEGNKGEEDVVNQIVFYVAPSTYNIAVFADYIPDANVSRDGNNIDYFYNTHLDGTKISMRTTPGSDSDEVSPDFFNNERYDCFYKHIQVEKTEEKMICEMELQRIVAKVRFLDNSSEAGEYDVWVSKLGIRQQYDMKTDVSLNPVSYNSNSGFQNKKVSSGKSIGYSGNKEVISFYTFAHEYNPNSNQRTYLKFMVSDPSNASSNKEFDVNNIDVQKNYITTVTGNLLTGILSNGDSKGEEPDNGNNGDDDQGGDNNDDGKGPIYLNLSVSNENWGQQTKPM